ncbi:MAG: GTP 3',8-cyclase MoaA [Pseudomonadota bacterium]
MNAPFPAETRAMHDGQGRRIDYVRLSLTDRCNLRCQYCMGEDVTFLPRGEVLSLEEIAELARQFVARGVTRIRLTGGEPLVRRGAVAVATEIGRMIGHGLDELTLTTNATQLAEHAQGLWDAGVRRINISLDTLEPERFRQITRNGDLDRVLEGIEVARSTGFAIKINMVVLKGINDDELLPMLRSSAARGFDLSLIETMPVGQHIDAFFPLTEARSRIEAEHALIPSTMRTGGPARYWQVPDLGITLGLISPLTRNFCDSCNRIRVSASGQLYMCLGHDDHVDLRAALRSNDPVQLDDAIGRALRLKPARHDFDLTTVATVRHMNATGG